MLLRGSSKRNKAKLKASRLARDTTTVKLSRTSREVLDDFDKAAQHYGWQLDQGSVSSAEKAKQQWQEEKIRLAKRIHSLESALKKAREGNQEDTE